MGNTQESVCITMASNGIGKASDVRCLLCNSQQPPATTCNALLFLSCRLSYRTGQDTANCDTCRNSACIIYRYVNLLLPLFYYE